MTNDIKPETLKIDMGEGRSSRQVLLDEVKSDLLALKGCPAWYELLPIHIKLIKAQALNNHAIR